MSELDRLVHSWRTAGFAGRALPVRPDAVALGMPDDLAPVAGPEPRA